jgi:hypothetical protein
VAPCAGPCRPRPYGGPDAIDLRGRSLGYVWRIIGGRVVGVAGWELRAARIGARRSALAAAGIIGGACGFSLPNSPQADAGGVTFVERAGDCLTARTPFVAFERKPRRWRTADPPGGGFAYALGRDAGTYYWIRGVVPEAESPPAFDPCRVPAACVLVRSPAPAYGPPERRKVAPPIF